MTELMTILAANADLVENFTADELRAIRKLADLLPEIEGVLDALSRIKTGCPAAAHILSKP